MKDKKNDTNEDLNDDTRLSNFVLRLLELITIGLLIWIGLI